jgi:hypothetical protein
MRDLFLRLRGRYRMLYSFCPACNSAAPEIDTCPICSGYRWSKEGKPTKYALREWWSRYTTFLKGPTC